MNLIMKSMCKQSIWPKTPI